MMTDTHQKYPTYTPALIAVRQRKKGGTMKGLWQQCDGCLLKYPVQQKRCDNCHPDDCEPDITAQQVDSDPWEAELAAAEAAQTPPDLRAVDDWTEADDEADFAKVLASAIPGAELPPTPPVVCTDFAGLPILHGGELTFVYGHPKAGKSWATLAMAKQTVEAGGRVLMICWERVEGTRRRRHRITRHDHTAYHGWAVIPHTDAGNHLDRWIAWLNEAPFSLVVFDSMSSAGVPTDGTSFSEWYRTNIHPFTAPTRALCAIDHSPKRKERDVAKGPLGSATKMAHLDAAYLINTGTPGKPITDTDLKLEGANEAWSPQTLKLHIREGIPNVINGDDHTDDQLFHMIKQGTLTERDAANRAIQAGVTTSRSTFQRHYKQWLNEPETHPDPQ